MILPKLIVLGIFALSANVYSSKPERIANTLEEAVRTLCPTGNDGNLESGDPKRLHKVSQLLLSIKSASTKDIHKAFELLDKRNEEGYSLPIVCRLYLL